MNDVITLARRRGWTDGEIMGVSTLIATIAAARALVDTDAEFDERMRRWERQLDALGIGDVGRSSHGSGSGGVPRDFDRFRIPGLDLRIGGARLILPEREIGEAGA